MNEFTSLTHQKSQINVLICSLNDNVKGKYMSKSIYCNEDKNAKNGLK